MADLEGTLTVLGFTRNEARAYVALVRNGAQTGYEVGQRAGVPRSAVYAVLRKLAADGAARSLSGSPEKFMATPPEALIAALKRRFESTATAFEEAVRDLSVAPEGPDAFAVRGYERILEEAARVAASASRLLVVSGWPREIVHFADELAKAEERGVFVVVFSHAKLPSEVRGRRFSTGLEAAELEAFWKHRLVVVSDDRTTLVGATEGSPDDRGVVSETEAIAEIVVSQVALDVTLLCERYGVQTSAVMAKMLGDRVGRLGPLLPLAEPELGGERAEARPPSKKRG